MIADEIRRRLEAEVGSGDWVVERPKQADHGDYATNAALVTGNGGNPRESAEKLAKKLQADDLFESVEVAGPGFINFRVSAMAWQKALGEILKAKERFGSLPSTGKKIQVEFISANPTGPLTLGNGRGGFGGDVLANALARAGNTVEREYYINDSGGQTRMLGEGLKGEGEGYKGEYVDELKKKLVLGVSADEVGRKAADLLIKDIEKTIDRMGISFDTWFSEDRELHTTKEVEATLKMLEKSGETFEKDGALWLRTSKYGDDKDRVIRKSDLTYTYVLPDIAYHFDKFAKRKFDRVINIWGSDHHGDVKRLKVGIELLRKQRAFKGELVIILTQLVRLISGGKEVKMSKRAGTYVTLDELLDEIPVDVARFFFVMKSFDTHMDFDLDLAKEQSQKNPVYYLKYAHARIAGILVKATVDPGKDFGGLEHPTELALIRELDEFPDVIDRTADDYQVQRLPHYALGIADAFHRFYENCPVISDDKKLTAARLGLVRGTQVVLQNVGTTLGIDMPERM